MAERRKLQLEAEVTADTSGLDQIAQAAQEMAVQVQTAGQQAAQGVVAVGTATDALTRRQSALLQQIERTAIKTTEGNAAWLAHRAAIEGVSAQAAPYLERLRAMEQGQRGVAESSRQTAQALRQVAPQMTDIVTSLAAGQAPLQVLIQQGGQLKDIFGGVGPAARALGGYIAGLINPFTLAAAAAAGLTYAFVQGAKEQDAYQRALITTGNAAGVTASRLADIARELGRGNFTQSGAAAALAEMVKSGAAGADQLQRFTQVAMEFERTVGQAVSKTAEQFKALRDAPLEASVKLNGEIHHLTLTVYEHIRALEQQGRQTDAARVAQDAYADAISGQTQKIVENNGILLTSWNAVLLVAKKTWDAMLGIGRDATGSEQLKSLREQLAIREERGALRPQDPKSVAAFEAGNQELRERIGLIERLNTQTAESAAKQAATNQSLQDRTKWDREGLEFLNKRQQREQALAKATVEGQALMNAGLITQAQLTDRLNAIREKFKDPKVPKVDDGSKELERQQRLLIELAGLSGNFLQQWNDLNAAFKRGAISSEQLEQAQRKLLESQPFSREQAREAEAIAKATAEFTLEVANAEQTTARHTASLEESARAAERDLEQFGLLKSQIQELTLARLEDMRAAAAAGGEDVDQIDRRITAQKRLIDATRGIESKETAKKAADETEREWKRTAESIEQSLTDALLRGFESGKSGAENFRDTLKNMFATLVLRPAIQAVMSPVSGALSGIGQGIGSAITGGGGSALGGLGSLGSLGGGLGMLGGVGSAFTAGSTSVGVMAGSLGGAGGLMGGVASALAAVPVAGWIGLAAIALYSVLSKKRGGPKAEGFFNPYNQDQYYSSNNAQTMSAAREQAQAFKAQYDAIVSAYGGTGGVQFGLGYSTDPKGDAPSQVHFGIGRNGQAIANIVNTNVGRSDEELTAAIAEQGSRAVLLGLQQSNIGGIIGDYLQSLGDVATAAADTVTEALQRVQKAGTERQVLEAQLFDLTHTELERLVATRQREREALDESNRALYDHVARLADLQAAQNVARDTLLASYQTESASLQAVVERHRGYAAQLRETRDALALREDSPLSATQRAALARSQFQGLLAGARAGDETALQNLGGSGTSLLEAARAAAHSPVEVAAAFARVQAGLTVAAASADSRATVAQQQLDTMTQQLTALNLINTSVVSVRDALAHYLSATAAFNREAGHAALGGYQQGATVVGERGQEMVDFDTPGRVYSADQTAGMFASNAALEPLLRQVVTVLQSSDDNRRLEAVAIAAPLAKIDARQRKWDAVGMPPVVEIPA